MVAVPALVGLSPAAVSAWIVQNGADLAKVHFVEMPLSQMADAVARGVIAAAHIGEPQLTAGMAEVTPIAKPYDAIALTFILSCDWFLTHDWVTRNRETAKRFVAAAYETARWANANHEQSLSILAKYAKYDLESVRNMRRARYATSLDARLVQPVLDAGAKFKMLARPFNATDLIVQV
jgi:NitT/TauT family transport system substrate-binding protein